MTDVTIQENFLSSLDMSVFGMDLSSNEGIQALNKANNEFLSNHQDDLVKKEITEYFCEYIKEVTGLDDLCEAWDQFKQMKEVPYER